MSMTAEELATITRLIDETARELVPLDIVREFARIRHERLTGTLEIDVRDGKFRSKRLLPTRDRIQDDWEST